MTTASTPALSVVLATPGDYEMVRSTIGFLRAQTVADTLELVIVAASEISVPGEELEGFFDARVVSVGPFESHGKANAAGVRVARAPVVVLAEDHAYPDPDWAGALIEAHAQDWVAVGPAVRNGNPRTRISRADVLIGYGPWLEPVAGGEVDFLPGHNTSYKRSLLLEYGTDLDSLMEAETILHWNLRAAGHRLRLEPRARIAHLNIAQLGAFTQIHFNGGRIFATTRARHRHWSVLNRWCFAAGTPLVPLIRLWRIVRNHLRASLSVLPILAYGLTVDALGQFCGCLLGAGEARAKLVRYEFDRVRYIESDWDAAGVFSSDTRVPTETR
jgi:hypothetical protein